MSTASSLTIDEMPSPIKPREDHISTLPSPEQVHTPRPPPSPLETEIDSDQGGPSSVEAQADPNDLSFDLDLDLPTSSYPLVSPQPSTSANDDILPCGPVNENEPNPFVDLFTPVNGGLEPDVKVEGAVAGVCGFYNFANTCYMNSGLQCLLATPTIVKYFTDSFELDKDCFDIAVLVAKFQPLLRDVWAGDYNLLKPMSFKETLSIAHPQFAGAHQHDCQEFLALLLDTMHEELRQIKGFGGKNWPKYESDCGTSMDMHTAHSTEKGNEGPLSMSWLSRTSSLENDHSSIVKRVNNHQNNIDLLQDGTESRGSASSPKSYDSRSSVEDKVAKDIRQLPIPKTLKVKNGATGGSDSHDEDLSMEDDMSTGSRYIGHEDEDTMDSSNSSNQPTSNLIAPDALKRHLNTATSNSANSTATSSVRFSMDSSEQRSSTGENQERMNGAENSSNGGGEPSINNAGDVNKSNLNLQTEESFYQKENKTLNVNVLAEESEEMQNNEITFDSEKFAKSEAKSRPRGTIENNLAGGSPPTASCTGNVNANTGSAKRLKNEENHADQVMNDDGLIKRIRLDSQDKEKNIQLEMERTIERTTGSNGASGSSACGLMPTSPTQDTTARLKEAIEADRYWEKYLAINDTVLARTFQGQFKSSVVCRDCNYVSVSFEPFMYLPVPLPNANIRQVHVTYIDPDSNSGPMALMLDMCQADNVGHLKAKLTEELALQSVCGAKFQIAEVVDHHISRVVDDWTLLRCMKEDRQIYAIKVVDYLVQENGNGNTTESQDSTLTPDTSGGDVVLPEFPINNPNLMDSCSATTNTEYQSCVICMEDLPTSELKQHNACDCVICVPCLERTIEHHMSYEAGADTSLPKDHIKCPGCRQEAEPETEFVSLDQIGKSKPKLRILNLPVLCRNRQSDGKFATLGHPAIAQVPNQISSRDLHTILKPFMPTHASLKNTASYTLALVNAQGKLCSRCIFNSHCYGCIEISPETADQDKDILLQINDTIAITFNDEEIDVEKANSVETQHESMSRPRIKDKLTLEDCMEAFSRTEELDETNPWFCPMCRKNKCATKTLSVWRFPDYLIIYLKRFVFTNSGALKLEKDVEFEVGGLDLTPFLSGPLHSEDSRPIFDMYGCVCHFGCVYGGHYTAFSRHLGTDQWNHFNDNCIQESKVPGESQGDNGSAYILFYQRAGSKNDNMIPFLSRKCRAFALDNNEKTTGEPTTELLLNPELKSGMEACNGAKVDTLKNGTLVDEDEDETQKSPDLSQIIRSLDTPPPS